MDTCIHSRGILFNSVVSSTDGTSRICEANLGVASRGKTDANMKIAKQSEFAIERASYFYYLGDKMKKSIKNIN